jgi:hypothetical protein
VASFVWFIVNRARVPRTRRSLTLGAAVVLVLAATACTTEHKAVHQTPSLSHPESSPASSPTPVATPSFPAPSGYLRDCESSVSGGLSGKVIRQAAKAGPLAFVWVRVAEQAPPTFFRRRPDGYAHGRMTGALGTKLGERNNARPSCGRTRL